MRHFLTSLLLLFLVACGGGGGAPAVIPEGQAAVVLDSSPTGDATAQLQAIFDTAKEAVLPACTFNVTTLRVSRPLRISCASSAVDGTVIRFSGAEGVVVDPNVVVNIPTGGWNKRGYWFKMTDCRVEPSVQGGGKHPFVMRARKGFFISTSYVGHNHFGGAGAQGVLLDNTAGNESGGIFTTKFEDNFVENGFLGIDIGDSVHFVDNVVPDGATKVGTPGFDLSWISGAAESEILRGNVTTAAGCVVARNGEGLLLNHVWCETPGVPPGEQGAITLKNCAACTVRDVRIQTFGKSPYALAAVGSTTLDLASNKFNKGTQGHVLFVNSDGALTGLNRFDGARTGVITGAATGLLTSN